MRAPEVSGGQANVDAALCVGQADVIGELEISTRDGDEDRGDESTDRFGKLEALAEAGVVERERGQEVQHGAVPVAIDFDRCGPGARVVAEHRVVEGNDDQTRWRGGDLIVGDVAEYVRGFGCVEAEVGLGWHARALGTVGVWAAGIGRPSFEARWVEERSLKRFA